jgi:hypothetical protein
MSYKALLPLESSPEQKAVETVQGILSWIGSYRVYFNSREDAPKVWSVDAGKGSEEHNVEEVYIYTNAATVFRADEKEPCAWLEGFGHVAIADGVAVIEDKANPIVVPPERVNPDQPV